MCDNILRLLAVNVPSMDPILWPQLIDYLLAPDYNSAVPSIVKCLSHLVSHLRSLEGCISAVPRSNPSKVGHWFMIGQPSAVIQYLRVVVQKTFKDHLSPVGLHFLGPRSCFLALDHTRSISSLVNQTLK